MGILICKLPLTIIVAPLKLYNEYASRGQGIQIWGHRRPLIFRSRDPAKLCTKNRLKSLNNDNARL